MTDLTLDHSARRVSLEASREWAHRYGFAVAAYVVATFITGPTFMGDTVDYVESITLFAKGVDHNFWEFAHLLWRPLGFVLSSLIDPITSQFVGPSFRLNVTLTLLFVSWIAGLVCVIRTHAIARRVSGRLWIANFTAFAFIFTQGFLNFAQTGTSYILGMAFFLTGLELLISRDAPIWAGGALALSVLIWVNYLFAIPAAILAPLFLVRFDQKQARLVLRVAMVFTIVVASAYSVVIAGMHFHTVGEVRYWIASSSGGTDFAGVKRAIFGLARSFINMSNDGLLFKRFLLHDPFNPVSLGELLGVTLWKLAFFYVFIASLVAALLYSEKTRRVLALLFVNVVVVFGFAILFAGSDMERHLPLYPVLFIAMAAALSSPSPRLLKFTVVTFAIVAGFVNIIAMSRPVLERKQQAAASRIRELLPRLNDSSMVFVANWQDELINFSRAYPLHPINRSGDIHIGALVAPGLDRNAYWRATFASRSLSTWKNGGAVWICRRALAPRPRPEWNWCEGDDRRVSWTDFPRLFTQLQLGTTIGGPDGFVLIPNSSKNKIVLAGLAKRVGT